MEIKARDLIAAGWHEGRRLGPALRRARDLEPSGLPRAEALVQLEQEFPKQLAVILPHYEPDKLSAPKSHPCKALLAAAMKQSASVSNSWRSRRLDMGQPASASQFARRWRLTPAGQRSTAAFLSKDQDRCEPAAGIEICNALYYVFSHAF